MQIFKFAMAGAGLLALSAIFSAAPASASPLNASGTAVARPDEGLTQVQYRRDRTARRKVVPGRVARGGRYGHRSRGNAGGVVAAGVALGVLGAIAASQAPRARRACWIERRRTFNAYGDYVGTRRVRVCR